MVHKRSNLEGEKRLLLVRLLATTRTMILTTFVPLTRAPAWFLCARLFRDAAVSTRFHASTFA